MKKIFLLLATVLLFGCGEEVIDIDLTTVAPRLVIEASIDWQKGTSGNLQTIKLSTTTGFYDTVIPKVTGANVFVTNSANTVFNFTEEIIPNSISGKYNCINFIPVIGETYTLTIIYNGQTYNATEKLYATPSITNVEQINTLGINSDQIGIKVNFTDFANEKNYYLTRIESSFIPFPFYETARDEFAPGNNIPTLYSNEDLVAGSIVKIKNYGISETYYNFMNLVIGNVGASGPFQTPPTRVKGNIINQTNASNYALGYFRLGEVEKLDYTIQ